MDIANASNAIKRCLWAALVALPISMSLESSQASDLLFVTQGGAKLSSEEQLRKTQFEAWGYTVSTIDDSDVQANFDKSVASTSVVYLSEEVSASEVGYKLRTAAVGIVYEDGQLDVEFGIATSDAVENTQTYLIDLIDNTHWITVELSTGHIAAFNSNQPRILAQGTLAGGIQELARSSSGNMVLGIVDAGGALANSYSGNSTASGRRVRLPWGGDAFAFSSLHANGLLILKNALVWARCGDCLIGHWRLDETSGTACADSSPHGNDGIYFGGPSLGEGGAYPGGVLTAVSFDGTVDRVDLPNMDIDFSNGLSIALWVKPSGSPGAGQGYAFFNLSNGQDVDQIWLGWFNKVGFQLYMTDTDDGSPLKTIEDNREFEEGKWVHCVATVDSAGNATLYRNGEVTKSNFFTSIPTNVLRTQVSLASSPFKDNFPGSLDDVRLYNRPLNATEVGELYGLMGHWKMDEGTGTTVADSTAFGNDATLSGATWATDCTGKDVLAFDGAGSTVATNTSFDPPAKGTVAFWMQASGTPVVRERIFGLNGNWEARIETTGKISFDLGASPYVGNEPFATDVVDDKDRWYHIIAMFDASDESYEVYVNGELKGSGTSPVNLTSQTAAILSFGTRTGSTEYWEGSLRDFRIYNRWLSDTEISDLSGLIAYWKFEETSGTVAVDSSVAGNDATYIGSPTLGVSGPFVAKTGNAVGLDGSSQSISSGKSLLNSLPQFSLAAWVQPDSVTPDISLFGQNNLIELGLDFASNQIDFWTAQGGSIQVTGQLVLGRWTHIVATGDSASLRIYIDGVEVASGRSAAKNYGSNSELFKIGEGVLAPSGDYYAGRVDEVRVYSRAICPEEVRALYKGGRPSGIRILKWLEVR